MPTATRCRARLKVWKRGKGVQAVDHKTHWCLSVERIELVWSNLWCNSRLWTKPAARKAKVNTAWIASRRRGDARSKLTIPFYWTKWSKSWIGSRTKSKVSSNYRKLWARVRPLLGGDKAGNRLVNQTTMIMMARNSTKMEGLKWTKTVSMNLSYHTRVTTRVMLRIATSNSCVRLESIWLLSCTNLKPLQPNSRRVSNDLSSLPLLGIIQVRPQQTVARIVERLLASKCITWTIHVLINRCTTHSISTPITVGRIQSTLTQVWSATRIIVNSWWDRRKMAGTNPCSFQCHVHPVLWISALVRSKFKRLIRRTCRCSRRCSRRSQQLHMTNGDSMQSVNRTTRKISL